MQGAWLQFVAGGLTAGAIYALVALGFSIVYNTSHAINFAQGEFVMLGGMGAVALVGFGLPLPVAVLGAVAGAGLVGLLVQRLALEPAQVSGRADVTTLIIITIGVSLFLRGAAQVVWDKRIHPLPAFSGSEPLSFGGASLLPQSLWVLLGTSFAVLSLSWFFGRTLAGKAMRATAINAQAAQLMGVSTRVVMRASYALAALLGAFGGVLIAPIAFTSYDAGVMLGLKGFAAAMLGGLGSFGGAVAGGLLLGLLEAFGAGFVSSAYKDAIAFVVILAVLFFMPGGWPVRAAASVSEAVARRTAWPRLGALALFALLLVAVPLLAPNPYVLEVAVLVALNAIVCVGLNLLVGYAGQISLGHAGFFALGGYASALLAARFGWPVVVAMPAAVAAVAVLAWVVGRPTLRLKGHYLAMATLGLGVIVSIVLTNEDRITGGPDGMAVPPLQLFGWTLQGEATWYAVIAVALWLTVWGALNLIDSPVGRALRALHGSEIAAETAGIDSAKWKLRVFVLSAAIAAAAGVLTAHYAGFLTPAKASFLHSVELVIMVVFGGMASVWGAVVGAAVLTLLPQLLTALKDYEMMAFGAILIATMIFFPRGIVPTLARAFKR